MSVPSSADIRGMLHDVEVLTDLFPDSGSDWVGCESLGNRVWANGRVVAKISASERAGKQFRNAHRWAPILRSYKVRCPQPVAPVMDSPVGFVSAWEQVNHDVVTVDDLTGWMVKDAIQQLLKIEHIPVPLGYVGHRWMGLDLVRVRLLSHANHRLAARVGEVYELAKSRVPVPPATVLGHGDAHLRNMLYQGSNVSLIDFDSMGMFPKGWDLAAFWNNVMWEGGNMIAWGTRQPPPLSLRIIKALYSTSFLLTVSNSMDVADIIEQRCGVLEDVLATGREPIPGELAWVMSDLQTLQRPGVA